MIDKRIRPFKFWCQKVLPLVYDDSLSYYEVLNKVANKLNEVVTSQNDIVVNFDQLREDILNYFDTGVIETAVQEKLDEMLADGSLQEIINREIFDKLNTKVDTIIETNNYITPEMFGAKGDGETDDTLAIQAAINSLLEENKGKTLVLGRKTYSVTATLSYWDKINGPLVLNGCIINLDHSGVGINVGALKDVRTVNHNSIIGVGTINCKNIATRGIVIQNSVVHGIFSGIRIANVPFNGVGIHVVGTMSRCDCFDNIYITGSDTPNDITSVGILCEAWDCNFSNITTNNIAIGINSIGGDKITNHQHWANVAKYDNLAAYKQTYGLICRRGSYTNLYYECGTGVWVIAEDATEFENIHLENGIGDKEISDIEWLTEMVMFKCVNPFCQIMLGSYYFATHTQNLTKMKVFELQGSAGWIPNATRGFLIKGLARVTPFNYVTALAVVDEANNLCALNKTLPIFKASYKQNVTTGAYLIGYIKSPSQTGISSLILTYQFNRTYFDVTLNASTTTVQVAAVEAHGQPVDFGLLRIGAREIINNIPVYPVYYVPNGKVYPSHAMCSVTVKSFCGVAGYYNIHSGNIGNIGSTDIQTVIAEISLDGTQQ